MRSLLFTFLAIMTPYHCFAEDIESGVSFQLAQERKAAISNVQYDLALILKPTGPIQGVLKVEFDLATTDKPVVLDFSAPKENVESVKLLDPKNETLSSAKYTVKNGHFVVDVDASVNPGRQEIEIRFVAGNQSLNRNDDFLYTLLVPDRASTVFPCFDQPDIKAKFKLKLELPKDWTASGNGEVAEDLINETGLHTISFKQTKPISTYLFAFAAGKFEKISRTIDGREMTMFHRESDKEKVSRNLDKIFQTHAMAIKWMEDYTEIKYPFEKFDFVLIPSFQYGGMEHIGNIFYNADQLFLDESATKDQKLNRASLIAHETAHMWFGNLVTMKWFDDVWLKEVFANFMAAKIVHPGFPEINHELSFMLKHHPSAYGEDRSAGTYPIQQKLDNLKNAGTLYGRIIYQKAPIVMRQLETMIGQESMREGLQQYLKKFSYGNAVWDDLIEILDKKSDVDLRAWSAAWVKEPGTPELTSDVAELKSTDVLTIKQTRKTPEDKFWSQQVDLKVVSNGQVVFATRIFIEGETTKVDLPKTIGSYDFFLANGSELGYGYFQLDNKSKAYLLENVQSIRDSVTQGAAWLALYEAMVRGEVDAEEFLKALQRGLATEREPLNRQNITNQLRTVYWKFLGPDERVKFAPGLEASLWDWIDGKRDIENAPTSLDAKSVYYKTLVNIASSKETIERLYEIWESELDVGGLPMAEADYMTLAYELAVRLPEKSDYILTTQLDRIKNEDRKKRFKFVMPALSPDQSTRDAFFESLKDASNRRPERWALEALGYLHHPLRAESSEKFILPSLELLEEIQTTGDIFFPKTMAGFDFERASY